MKTKPIKHSTRPKLKIKEVNDAYKVVHNKLYENIDKLNHQSKKES